MRLAVSASPISFGATSQNVVFTVLKNTAYHPQQFEINKKQARIKRAYKKTWFGLPWSFRGYLTRRYKIQFLAGQPLYRLIQSPKLDHFQDIAIHRKDLALVTKGDTTLVPTDDAIQIYNPQNAELAIMLPPNAVHFDPKTKYKYSRRIKPAAVPVHLLETLASVFDDTANNSPDKMIVRDDNMVALNALSRGKDFKDASATDNKTLTRDIMNERYSDFELALSMEPRNNPQRRLTSVLSALLGNLPRWNNGTSRALDEQYSNGLANYYGFVFPFFRHKQQLSTAPVFPELSFPEAMPALSKSMFPTVENYLRQTLSERGIKLEA